MPSFATATAFLSTFGVNTHSGNAGYANASIVNNSLAYLGFHRVRDDLATLGTANAVTNALGAAGVKFDFVISSSIPGRGDAALTAQIKAIENFAATYKGSVIAIEGLNEANIQAFSYNGSSSLAAAGAFQKALYGAVKSNAGLAGIPVINMSLGMESDADAAALGDLGKYSDFANAHAYTATGQQADKVMEASLARARRTSTGDPVVITETGYTTLASNPDLGVNQSAQAKLTLNAMLLAFENGSQQTYLYELLDSNLQPDGAEKEKHFGLFNADGTPKLAATAVHNLTTILGHVDAGTGTDAGKASYTLGGLPADGHSMVLTKASGAWDLVVWRDVKVWNDPLDKENVTEAKTITVDLGGVQKTVYVYDPLGGTKPIAVYTNVSSIQLAVGDRPLVVEVGAAGPVVDLPPVSAPDLTMTAAQFAAQIDTLARSSGLKSVTLTDGKVIELASDATKDYVVRNYGALLGKIAGGGVSFKVTETGPNWREERSFDAAGKLTSTTDFAFEGGVLKHTRTVTAGGDVTDSLYTGGKLAQVVAVSGGRTLTTTYDVATGKVAELVDKSANGDVAISTYTRNVLSGYTLNRADGSRTIDEFDAAGVRTKEVTVDAAGTWTTLLYGGGVVKSRYVQRRDGSGENVSYGITGQPFASVRQVIDAKGAVTLVERARADGTLVSSEATAADGAKTNTTYGATGNKLTEVIAAADGRRTTLTYDATSGKLTQSIVQAGGDTVTTTYTGGVVTQLLTVRADGSRDTISYDAQGRKTSDVDVSAANVWTTQQFDAASGKLTRRFVQNPDGSGENVSYGITGQPYVTVRQVTNAKGAVTLVERTRADGTLVSSEAVAGDGAKTSTTYGATGNKLSEIVTGADGSRTTRNWDATTGKLAQSIVQAGGDTVTTSYAGGVVTQLLTVRANGSRDTISYDTQGRKVSDIEVSATNVWTTLQYDAASGKLTRKFVQNPDGTGENVTYGISGQPYVTVRQVTDAKGVATLVERTRADGTLVSSESVAGDGAKTVTTYGTTGSKLSEIVTSADGSRTTRNWDATSGKLAQSIVQAGGDTITTTYTGGVITQLLTVRADGSRDTISYDAQGRKTSDVEVTAGKTWITQQFDAATGKLTRKFVQNADGTGENISYGITGQPYVTVRQVTNAKGGVTLVERTRADGSLVSSEAVAVDGTKTNTTYGTTGNKLSEIVTGADGSRTTRTWDATTAKLVQSIVQSGGDTMTTTYTGGVVTQQLTVRADGSRDTISYDTQGRKTTEVSVSATRTWTTIQFDAATGNATRSFVQNADGSGENVTYGITGKSYVTQRQVTDAQGKVVEVFRIHADGTLDYHERNDADGAREISNFDAAGLKLNQLNVHADGSRVSMTFTPDTQTLAQKQTVTAAGDVINATFADGVMIAQKTVFADGRKVNEAIVAGTRQIDSFAADGKKISAVTVDSANTWTTLLYDAAGKPLRRYVERADHSGEVTAYGITGKSYVTETQVVDTAGKVVAVTRLHSDGSLDYTEVNAADGSSVLTYYDTVGRKTLSASIAANGEKFTTRLDAKSGAIVDTIAETATQTVQSVYKGGKVETRVTSDLTKGDRIVETFDAEGRLTTRATTDAANNWETLRYDVASGAVSRRFLENADGSGQNFTYTGSGATLVTDWQKYDTSKRIVAGSQTRADGTRIVAFTVAGDGTRTSEWFDAADRRQSQVTAATTGAKTSLYFDPGSQLLVKSIVQSSAGDTITALYRNGVVTERTTQMANGAKMTESFSAGGHDLSGVRALPGYQAFLFDNGSGKIAGTLADEVLLADGGGTTILTGGLGKDRFVIQRGASATITDFGAGSDLLDLSALTKGGQPTITLSEGNTILRFGSGETVTLAGVDPSRLVASPQASGVYMLG